MDFKEFGELVLSKLRERVGKEDSVLLHTVSKNNGLKLCGVIIMKNEEHISPTIYLESFYGEYIKGKGIEDIIEEIMQVYDEQVNQISFDPEKFCNIQKVRKRILYKLINYEKNEELLKDIPHRRFLDLAIVYYVVVSSNEFGVGSILIKNEHLSFWNITEEELYDLAGRNTPASLGKELMSIKTMIFELMERRLNRNAEFGDMTAYEFFKETANEYKNSSSPKMYVLTNKVKVNGAGTIFYKNVLKTFSEKQLGCKDLYILPSSIHEVILVPADDEDISPGMLRTIVLDANKSCVSEEEWLSDNIYIYRYESDDIELVKIV